MKLRHYFSTTLFAVCVVCSWAQKSEQSATFRNRRVLPLPFSYCNPAWLERYDRKFC